MKPLTLALVASLGLLATHTWFGPDLWYHLAWGRAILEQGRFTPEMPILMRATPVGNPYWLYQVLTSRLFAAGGVVAVSVLHVGVWLIIAALVARLARADRTRLGPIALTAFVVLAQMRLEYRPEVVSFLCLALMLTGLLETWPWWILVACEVIWVNVHGYFVFGPALGAVNAFIRRDRRSITLFGALSVATLVNPAGPFVFENVFALSRVLTGVGAVIEELTPSTAYAWWAWPMPLFWAYEGLVFCFVVLNVRREPFRGLSAGLGVVLGLGSIRFWPLMLILSAPVFGVARAGSAWPRWTSWLVLPAALGLALFITSGRFHRWRGSGTTFGIGLEWSEYPIGLTDFLKSRGFTGRLFNAPNDGGYFEYYLPAARIAADSSYTEVESTRAYFAAAFDPRAFFAVDASLHFDAAAVEVTNLDLVIALLHAPGWVTAYADSHRILFARDLGWRRNLVEFDHVRDVDLRRPAYAEAARAWLALADREGDLVLKRKVSEELAAVKAP